MRQTFRNFTRVAFQEWATVLTSLQNITFLVVHTSHYTCIFFKFLFGPAYLHALVLEYIDFQFFI